MVPFVDPMIFVSSFKSKCNWQIAEKILNYSVRAKLICHASHYLAFTVEVFFALNMKTSKMISLCLVSKENKGREKEVALPAAIFPAIR